MSDMAHPAFTGPVVISGARSVEDRKIGPVEYPMPTPRPGKAIFQSRYAGHKIVCSAPAPERGAAGQIIYPKALIVEFRGGFAELDNEKDAFQIAFLKAHPKFQIDFWDFRTVVKNAKKAKSEATVQALQDPEIRAAVIKTLQAGATDDFSLPKRPAAAEVVEPDPDPEPEEE